MLNLVVVVAYPLRERDWNIQDGPEVGLIGRIRSVVRVTAADQGLIATIQDETPIMPIRAIKADRRQQCSKA